MLNEYTPFVDVLRLGITDTLEIGDATSKEHDEMRQSQERIGFLVHELRNLISTALVAFEVLKAGDVGVSGSTGAVLQRSLIGMRDFIAHSVDEIRLTKCGTSSARISMPEFIQEVSAAAALAVSARGITLMVSPVEADTAIDADRQVLAAVVANLLQNAFKFTKPHTQVMLRVGASADRVLVEIEDECGGLPEATRNDVAPCFEQRGADRSGLGIGLAFSRWGVEANGGRLYARNLPGKGCVFTIDLPRAARAADAA